MTKWEYYVATWGQGLLGEKWVTRELEKLGFIDALDRLGADGWELAATVPLLRDGETREVEYVFKRPRS